MLSAKGKPESYKEELLFNIKGSREGLGRFQKQSRVLKTFGANNAEFRTAGFFAKSATSFTMAANIFRKTTSDKNRRSDISLSVMPKFHLSRVQTDVDFPFLAEAKYLIRLQKTPVSLRACYFSVVQA